MSGTRAPASRYKTPSFGSTRGLVDRLTKKFGSADHFRPICGLPLSTYFSAIKLKWILENNPAVQAAVDRGTAVFGTVECWLLWNLTGGVRGGKHVTDVTNASRTMLMDLATCDWSGSTCEALGIPQSMLPVIKSNSEVYGCVQQGPLEGVPIACCLGDQQAAMMGQLCLQPGSAKNTYGTGCFLLMNTGQKIVQSKFGLLTTVCFKLGPGAPTLYALEGSVAVLFDSLCPLSPIHPSA